MSETVKSLKLADPADKEKALLSEIQALDLKAKEFVLIAESDYLTATNIVSAISSIKKQLEEQRKEIVKPLNDHVKEINDRFKHYSRPLEQADVLLRNKMMAFRQEQERIRKEKEERLRKIAEKENAKRAKQAEKKGLPEPPAIIVPTIESKLKTVQAEAGTASIKKVWTYQILDETQIPREYLMVDEKKIAAVVKAGIRNIPGVQIYETEQLAVRAR